MILDNFCLLIELLILGNNLLNAAVDVESVDLF